MIVVWCWVFRSSLVPSRSPTSISTSNLGTLNGRRRDSRWPTFIRSLFELIDNLIYTLSSDFLRSRNLVPHVERTVVSKSYQNIALWESCNGEADIQVYCHTKENALLFCFKGACYCYCSWDIFWLVCNFHETLKIDSRWGVTALTS